MMKFMGKLWAFVFKTKTGQVYLIAHEKYNAARTPLVNLRHQKRYQKGHQKIPKDIILKLITADAGANRGGTGRYFHYKQ